MDSLELSGVGTGRICEPPRKMLDHIHGEIERRLLANGRGVIVQSYVTGGVSVGVTYPPQHEIANFDAHTKSEALGQAARAVLMGESDG